MKKSIVNNIISERYLVMEALGEGNTARVYKVRDLKTGEILALKKYKSENPFNKKELMAEIDREVEVLKYTTHPALPRVYNIISKDDEFYLVMEYVEGITLEQLMENQGLLSEKQAVELGEQILCAMYYLHSLDPPIVYRDLKPSNIILQENKKIRLIDFGTAKKFNKEFNADKKALGTPKFAAPEQYGDNRGRGLYNTDIRTDIYGVGSTLCYLTTGKTYRLNAKKLKINAFIISHHFKKVMEKSMQRYLHMRYQNDIDMLCDLKKCRISIVSSSLHFLKKKYRKLKCKKC